MVGSLKNSDYVMNQVFWLGLFPGLNNTMIDYVLDTIRAFASDVYKAIDTTEKQAA